MDVLGQYGVGIDVFPVRCVLDCPKARPTPPFSTDGDHLRQCHGDDRGSWYDVA
jgi:hypothetical protein